ncbi:hypothetical protein [Chengkuizengella axinellae]|uniref:CcmD family protein n=1 Tax=Chengkuizengella axinellae TaxID=3064388 RepID=A0ABT9J4W6_9BACL|nr:hypothetical protein [Chengkuizengella sp. 2205SS18-9]MDP5276651.1 hypothetical protein [Chengkuizengella sp. 2205SS18-9]
MEVNALYVIIGIVIIYVPIFYTINRRIRILEDEVRKLTNGDK